MAYLIENKQTTIISGILSEEIDLLGYVLVGLYTPANLASTSLKFTASPTAGGTFVQVKDKTNADYSITVDSSARYYQLNPADFAGLRFIKLNPGSSETNKTFTLVLRVIE